MMMRSASMGAMPRRSGIMASTVRSEAEVQEIGQYLRPRPAGRSTSSSKVESCLHRLYTVPSIDQIVPLRQPKPKKPTWVNPNMRTFNRNYEEDTMCIVRENFETMRPLTTADLPKEMHPRWKVNELGEKLTKTTYEHVHRQAAHDSWDVHRPMANCPAPWAHNTYPRAQYVTALCMSASHQQ